MRAAGVAVALAASVANAAAVVLQAAEAHDSPREESMRASLLVRLSQRPRWLAGTALIIVGGVLQVLALALAPIAIVQPALARDMLWLLALARLRLGERVGAAEALGAAAILGGLATVVLCAPTGTFTGTGGSAVWPPLAAVAAGALLTSLIGRRARRAGPLVVIGAGLAYSWSDFASKLLAVHARRGAWGAAALWLVALLAFGALAFLEENSALQRRPAVTVAPVIDAVKVPLPVLMALWAGLEHLARGAGARAGLLGGLALVAAGAATLGRSSAVARLSGSVAG